MQRNDDEDKDELQPVVTENQSNVSARNDGEPSAHVSSVEQAVQTSESPDEKETEKKEKEEIESTFIDKDATVHGSVGA